MLLCRDVKGVPFFILEVYDYHLPQIYSCNPVFSSYFKVPIFCSVSYKSSEHGHLVAILFVFFILPVLSGHPRTETKAQCHLIYTVFYCFYKETCI